MTQASPAMGIAPEMLPFLVVHVTAGIAAILSGAATVAVRKGEGRHRLFGTIFVVSMLTMASAALYMAVELQQRSNIAAALLAFYLTSTGFVAARRRDGPAGPFERAGLVLILAIGALFLSWGIQASLSPEHALDHYRPVFYYVFAGIAGLFAATDIATIRRGVVGAQRIARHLWRMCFAFFFASGSFFLGQQKVMPVWMHGSKILLALGLAPLAVMIFWLVRVRLTKWYKTADPRAAA